MKKEIREAMFLRKAIQREDRLDIKKDYDKKKVEFDSAYPRK